MYKCDVLIVGAGFSGLVMAERLSSEGKHCLVVDKRGHIGGNAYDFTDMAGVLVHRYGSHLFHTNSTRIFDYLSRFTSWIPAEYTGRSFTGGKYWSFPINLRTYEQLVGHSSTPEEMQAWLNERKVPIARPQNSEEAIISQVGWELYEKFYRGYVLKHWHREPRQLDASVCLRIPIRSTYDDLYFNDTHQCMPADGYTKMFEKMIASPLIQVMLNTDYRNIGVDAKWTVYTGPVDEYFGYRHGVLPYRSVRFEMESFGPDELKVRESISGKMGFWQPTFLVSYPNSETFTRIIEIKHVTGQQCPNTTIVRDYPENYVVGKEAYYPVPAPDAAKIYAKYKEMADACNKVSFIGRLATYKYFNMDQVVGSALSEFERLRKII